MPMVVAWLECLPFPPVALREGTFTIGRSDCDLVLPHKEVSRRHVEIVVRPGDAIELLLRERGSQNGTLLNGELVQDDAPLLLGDVITIGPFDLQVRGSDADRDLGASDTDAAAVLSGRFRDVPLDEVVGDLELCERTGHLEVVLGTDRSGRISVHRGRPVSAALGPLRDVDAILAMLTPTRVGRFQFRKVDVSLGAARLPSFTQLRLEASRRQDEGQVRPAIPPRAAEPVSAAVPPAPPARPEASPLDVDAHVPTFESRRLRRVAESGLVSPIPGAQAPERSRDPKPPVEVRRVHWGPPPGQAPKDPQAPRAGEPRPVVEVRRVHWGPKDPPAPGPKDPPPVTASRPAVEVRRVLWGPRGPTVEEPRPDPRDLKSPGGKRPGGS